MCKIILLRAGNTKHRKFKYISDKYQTFQTDKVQNIRRFLDIA